MKKAYQHSNPNVLFILQYVIHKDRYISTNVFFIVRSHSNFRVLGSTNMAAVNSRELHFWTIDALSSLILRSVYTIDILSNTQSIYEGLRRLRWYQFASEIYKVDTIVYGTYNVGTWSFHLRVVSIVTSSVPISLENTKTTRTRLRLYI